VFSSSLVTCPIPKRSGRSCILSSISVSFFPRSYLLNFTDSLETPLPSVHAYWLYNEGMLIVADLSPSELRAHLFSNDSTGVHKLCRTKGCGVGELAIQLVDGMFWSSQTFHPCEKTGETGQFGRSKALPSQLHGPFTWHARYVPHLVLLPLRKSH